jgi:hypothetical protein
MPDDELLTQAERNKLSDPATLDAQIKRMLADPRASAVAEKLCGAMVGNPQPGFGKA